MPLSTIKPGSTIREFPAGTFNTLVDLARVYQRDRARFSSSPVRDTPTIKWRNDSGETAPDGAIIRFTGAVEVDNAVLLTGNKPDTTLRLHYGVAIGPVANGAIGDCTIHEPARARYLSSDGTPAFGQTWGIEPGQWYLRKGRYGFQVLGDPADNRVLAIQRPSSIVGKFASPVSEASGDTPTSGTLTLWYFNGSAFAATSLTTTAYNFSKSIEAGQLVACHLSDGIWCVEAPGESGESKVWHATAQEDLTPGFGTGDVLLPDSSVVQAMNWSDGVTIKDGDKIIVFQDPADDNYYAFNPAGCRWLEGRLDGSLSSDDTDAVVDGLIYVDTGSDSPLTTVRNPFELRGSDNDRILVLQTNAIGEPLHVLVQVLSRGQPHWFLGTLGGSLAADDGTVTVNITTELDGGVGGPSSVAARNELDLAGDNGSKCLVVEDLSEDPIEYVLAAVVPPEITVVTNIRYDDSAHKWQKKTRTILAAPTGEESDWTDVLTLTQVDVVKNVDVSGTALRQTKKPVYVAEADSDASPATIDAGTECP